jgi:hypothetical protein
MFSNQNLICVFVCVCVCALALPYDCDVLNNVTVLGEMCNFLVQIQLIHCVCCVVLFNCKMLFIYFCIVTATDVIRFAIQWDKDGRSLYLDTIQTAPKDPRIVFRSSDSSLVITNVSANDSGHYFCIYSSTPPVKLMHVVNVFGKRNKAQYAVCACLDGRSRFSFL